MLKIEQFSEYLRVTGYEDGSDWWVLPDERPHLGFGVAGEQHLWYGEQGGRLHILHAPSRQRTATVQLEGFLPSFARPLPVSVSHDERRLFVLESLSAADPIQGRVHVVDVVAGAVVAVHGGLAPLRPSRPLERPDGRLLLPTYRQSLVLLDPATGEWEESGGPGGHGGAQFGSGSPDGRYWLRFDATSLPVHDPAPGLLGRLLGAQPAERRYGVVLQIWEAYPLRFVRRVVVAWLTADELSREYDLSHAQARAAPTALPSRGAMWDAVAAAAAPDTLGVPLPRSAYPPSIANDDVAWTVIEQNVKALADGSWGHVVGWQPDGEAFWASTNRLLSCVGVDGTLSPRLYTQRLGLQSGGVQPAGAAWWREVVPLPGRQARVRYNEGEALFDGAPSDSPYAPHAIPAEHDHWQPTDNAATERERSIVSQRYSALVEQRRRVVVPFAGWTETGCVAAIDALTGEVTPEFRKRAVGDEIRIVFASDAGEISEEEFFTEAGARFPGIAPAIRLLIDRYCDVAESNDFLFSRGEEGIGIFGWAVKALGVRDHSALPTLRRYGAFVDPEHEYYFAGTTVPAVIAAHGWTDEVVDFVFWVLAWNFYNTLQDYAEVWREWGLRDAVVHREPRAFARHVAADLAEAIQGKDDLGQYGTGGLDKLAKQIPQPHEPWAVAFFAELERLFAEPVDG